MHLWKSNPGFRFPWQMEKTGFKKFPQAFRKKVSKVKFNFEVLLWLIASFFISRASIMGEITPFAFIFWAQAFSRRPGKRLPVTLAVLSGWALSSAGIFPPWFLPAAMLLWLTLDFLAGKIFKKKIALSFTLPLTIIILRLPLLHWFHFTVYEAFAVGLEVALAILLPPLLQPFLEELKTEDKSRLSPEAIVGGSLLFSLIFLGMSDLVIMGSIKLINVVAPLLILVGAFLWGPVVGVVAGIVLGLFLSFGNPALFPYIGALGTAGLTAGLLRPYHRLWIATGYFCILRFLAYYSFEGGYILTHIWEDFIVVLIFLLVPLAVWERLMDSKFSWPFKVEDEEKLKYAVAKHIKNFAAVFQELATTFRPLLQVEEVRSKSDFSPLIENFVQKVCASCKFQERCWQSDLANQYRRVLAMLSAAEENDKFSERFIPVKLRRYCPRQKEMVKAVNHMREIYRLNCYWQEKMYENRLLVSGQLEGVSSIMQKLAKELKLEAVEKRKHTENESIRFAAEIGVAQVAKDGQTVTGDSYAVLPLKDGKQAIIISDGMGSGKKARLSSLSTVKLMKHLLEIGFRREMIISTLNTLLCLGYPSERFSTLDLAFLNLHSGEIELYKLGAPPSFLKKGEMIRTVGSVSLPVGILEDISPAKECLEVPDGGVLVMVTDGLVDARQENDENWIVGALQEIPHDHPQVIADRLIEEACYRWPRGVQDDLTVLVSRLKPLFGK
ncbi:MAG: SpoIIE family protein phosphatase [Firmicutes bacterium]|nr:SpoIIE family protein phosphatase [Bacillota bacterium]